MPALSGDGAAVGLGLAVGSGQAFLGVVSLARDRQVLEAMANVLAAAGGFGEVTTKGLPALAGGTAEVGSLGSLQLESFSRGQGWCEPTGVSFERLVTFSFTIEVRDEDQDFARSEADRLYCVAANTIGGQCFAGVTVCDKTFLEEGKLIGFPEGARCTGTGRFSYFVFGWQSHNADPP